MSNQNRLKDSLEYGRELASSAIGGADAARRSLLDQNQVLPDLSRAAQDSWQPAVIGAGVGALVAYLTDHRRSTKTAAAGALLGAAVGFAGGVLWGSRSVTGPIAKGALAKVNETRDRHWLEKNPVVYG